MNSLSKYLVQRPARRTGANCIGKRSSIAQYATRHEVVLRREIPEKRTPRYACRFRDVVYGGLVEALFDEQFDRRIPDGIAHELLLSGLQGRMGAILPQLG